MKFGADLECLLSYNLIRPSWISQVIKLLEDNNLSFLEERAFLAYGEDYVIPHVIASNFGLRGLLKKKFLVSDYRRIIFNCEGQFFDTISKLSIIVEFDIGVISISIPEGFIWNFDTDNHEPKIERLESYTLLCKKFAERFPPQYSTIVNLGLHSEDVSVKYLTEERKKKFKYGSHFLSGKEIEELYNWYTTEYVAQTK